LDLRSNQDENASEPQEDLGFINKNDSPKVRLLFRFLDKVIFAGAIIWISTTLAEDKELAIIDGQEKANAHIESLKAANDRLLNSQDSIHDLHLALVKARQQEYLDSVRQERALENSVALMKRELKADLQKIDTVFEKTLEVEKEKVKLDSIREVNKDRLRVIKERLSLYYWPILVRLEKNNSILDTYNSDFLLNELEQEVLVKNHLAIVNTLENYQHLAYADSFYNAEIKQYLSYVSLYEAMQAGGFPGEHSFIGGNELRNQF